MACEASAAAAIVARISGIETWRFIDCDYRHVRHDQLNATAWGSYHRDQGVRDIGVDARSAPTRLWPGLLRDLDTGFGDDAAPLFPVGRDALACLLGVQRNGNVAL